MHHKKIDLSILFLSVVPFFIFLPDLPSSLSNPPFFLVIWFFSFLALCLTPLKYGQASALARILLFLGGATHLALKFEELNHVRNFLTSILSTHISIAGVIFFFLSCMKKKAIDDSKTIEIKENRLRAFIEKHELDKPFYILNLIDNQLDPIALAGIRKAFSQHEPDFSSTIALGIRGRRGETFHVCFADEEADFFLVCLSITGFELIVCGLATNPEIVVDLMAKLTVSQLKFFSDFSIEGDFDETDIRSLQVSTAEIDLGLSPNTDIFKEIRLMVRQEWPSLKAKIEEKRVSGLN